MYNWKQINSKIMFCFIFAKILTPVSSFFQVPGNGSPASYLEQAHKEKALQQMQQMSSAQIVSASAMHQKSLTMPPGVSWVINSQWWN